MRRRGDGSAQDHNIAAYVTAGMLWPCAGPSAGYHSSSYIVTIQMCILFFLVGDSSHPTIICSNRDEYYLRPTQRGRFVTESRYMPQDLEGGGSWLVFDNLTADHLRFAVVLNFHDWREEFSLISKDNGELLSRGKLVQQFIAGDLFASDYATLIFSERSQYRPFNLIVSDQSGTFYVSTSRKLSAGPERLQKGKFYGLTNGYLPDQWDKVTHGLSSLSNITPDCSADRFKQMFSPTDGTKQAICNSVLANKHPCFDFISQLLSVMKDHTPLADPTFHDQSEALMRLASVFALPTHILNGKQLIFQPADLLPLFTLPSSSENHADRSFLFGTRTITLLIHGHSEYIGNSEGRSVFVILEDDLDFNVAESIQVMTNIDVPEL